MYRAVGSALPHEERIPSSGSEREEPDDDPDGAMTSASTARASTA